MFRVLELCAGYGSQAMALKEIGLDIYSEIAEFDKYASEAYMQLHGETKNYGDIYKIDESKLPYFDMITYSTPCQDFSVAGNQRGGEKGSGTRSSLLWECERIIRAVKPKYLLMENVKNLMSDKFRHTFNEWFGVLESMGYRNYYKVLNAKDYGVPQNRERIFCVSILGDQQFLFPNPIKLEKRLKDILEPKVDERFYIAPDKVDHDILNRDICKTIRCGGRGSLDKQHAWDIVVEPLACASRGRNPENPGDRTPGAPTEQRIEINWSGCTNTLTSVQKDNYLIEPKVEQVAQIYPNSGNPQAGRIYNSDGISPTVDTCTGGNRMPKILQNPHGYNKGGVHEFAPTLTSSGKYQDNNFIYSNYRIRKLTPRECWRLMGVPDAYFDKLHDLSNTQLYKLAGNSIVVDVLKAIFKNLLMPEKVEIKGQLNLL